MGAGLDQGRLGQGSSRGHGPKYRDCHPGLGARKWPLLGKVPLMLAKDVLALRLGAKE